VHEQGAYGWTPLLLGARVCRNLSFANQLKASRHTGGVSRHVQDDWLSHCYRTMELLLEHGADPNASRADRDSLLEVAEGLNKSASVLLLAFGADMSKTEAYCRKDLPAATGKRIEEWLNPWKEACPICDLPNLDDVMEGLHVDVQSIISHTVSLDWEVPVVLERIQRLNPDMSAYDCLRDEVVLIAYGKLNSSETGKGVLEATTCGEFVERKWGILGQTLLKDVARRCPLKRPDDDTGQYHFIFVVSDEHQGPSPEYTVFRSK
jgi:hypothetical protein